MLWLEHTHTYTRTEAVIKVIIKIEHSYGNFTGILFNSTDELQN